MPSAPNQGILAPLGFVREGLFVLDGVASPRTNSTRKSVRGITVLHLSSILGILPHLRLMVLRIAF